VVDQVLLDDVVPSIRAEVLVLRANLEDDALVAVDFLSEAVDYCGDDRDLRVRILLLLAERHSQELGDLDRADRFVGEAGACAEGLDDAHLRALILKWAGMIASLRGSAAHELAWAAVELEQEFPPPFGVSSARAALALQLGWAGELEEARALLEKTLAELSARGMEFDRAWQLPWLAEIELRQGDLDGAYRHAREVEDLFDPDHAWGQATVNALHARLAVHSGAADEARRLLLDALDHAERTNLRLTVLRSRWLLGFLELSRGDPAAAWRWLGGLADELDLLGIRQPGVIPVLPDAIETLVELGEVADAERLLQRLDAQAAALGHRWALAAVARSRALLLLARQKTDAALDQAEESASQFAALGIPLDQARALLVAGGVLRRRGERRRAAEALASAAAIFERVGAHLWLDRAREERARADPHPGRKDALTPAEQRVATLVAAGRTNREVAAQLYITVATVEAHLTRIYRKLDVRSRAELARRFALQPDQTHISG
jgi:DNA-binding CsgD family transcriptional regulator/tetratricopeptide (TPR) repeat protein